MCSTIFVLCCVIIREIHYRVASVSEHGNLNSRKYRKQGSRAAAKKPHNAVADLCIGLSRYTAITNLPIIAVFVEYLRQFLIDLNQIYRHSSVPQSTSPCIYGAF